MKLQDPDSASDEPTINLIPMIDVVLTLLIFFFLATKFAEAEKEIPVDLPRSSEQAGKLPKPDEMVVTVQRDGKITFGGATVEPPALVAALRNAAAKRPDARVTIRGDRLAHHEQIVRVMDACGRAGLLNLSVGTLQGD